MIHVCYGIRDESGKFSKYPATSICSMLENTREHVTIHLIHDSTLSRENRERFIELVERYGQRIEFYNVDEIFPDRIRSLTQRFNSISKFGYWNFGAMYRLLAPELIELPKIIYFDTDILVNLDVAELWEIEIENYPIAAKPEANVFPDIKEIPKEVDLFEQCPKKICNEFHLVKRENYFASDSMILNLDLIRRIFAEESTTLIDCALSILEKFPLQYIDQDALNFLFSETCLHLPTKFNVFINQTSRYSAITKSEVRIENYIYHYSGYNQRFNPKIPTNRLWFKYFCKTPFYNDDFLFSLTNYYKTALDDERVKLQRMMSLANRKHLAAFVFESDVAKLEQFKFNEIIIVEENLQHNVQNLINFLQKDPGKNFVIVFIAGFETIKGYLTQLGFVEGEDFCDGLPFLIREHGGSFFEDCWIFFYT